VWSGQQRPWTTVVLFAGTRVVGSALIEATGGWGVARRRWSAARASVTRRPTTPRWAVALRV